VLRPRLSRVLAEASTASRVLAEASTALTYFFGQKILREV
jgi:hypothetical protein